MDVKVGRGAFMKTEAEARELATWLVGIAERNGVRTEAVLTAMDAPLGRAVGNASEMIESIETLKGRGPRDLEDLSVDLAARMVVRSGVAKTMAEAEQRVRRALSSGAGVEKFRAIIEEQGGDPRVIDDYDRFAGAQQEFVVAASSSGYVTRIDAELIGRAAVALGAGRDRIDSVIDYGVGIEIAAPLGTAVSAGDAVLRVRHNTPTQLGAARPLVEAAIEISAKPQAPATVILDVIRGTEFGERASFPQRGTG